RSPYYDEQALERGVGIRFKGVEKTNVEEYCVSEGWIRVSAGNAKDRHGNPLTIKLNGAAELPSSGFARSFVLQLQRQYWGRSHAQNCIDPCPRSQPRGLREYDQHR